MDIFINERSFANQTPAHSARALLQQLADTVEQLRLICTGAQVVVHSTLSSCSFCNGQTLVSWLSTEHSDTALEDDEDTALPPLQALIGILFTAFSQGPYLEALLEEQEHVCYFANLEHDNSALAGAACLGGVVVSLEGHPAYVEGKLTVQLILTGGDLADTEVAHFVGLAEVRKCRRRYLPNPKHHPSRAKGEVAAMALDSEYDLFTSAREMELRHPDANMPDTRCQRLLDAALPGGKQLYALVYAPNGRDVTFYEFQPDNANGFHGYPVPQSQVPADVVRALRTRV